MGKKKNKRLKQLKPTTNPFWSNIGNIPLPGPRANLIDLKKFSRTGMPLNRFQAPHHQQDSIMDLTDDTSPNNPMNKGQPSNSNQGQTQKRDPATEPIFEMSDEIQKEDSFHDDVKPSETFYDQKHSAPQTNWVLKETADKPKGVVQGTASGIKFVVQGSKSVTVATSLTTTVANEKPKPTILAATTIATLRLTAPVQGSKSLTEPTTSATDSNEKPTVLESETFTAPRLSMPTSAPNLTIKGVQQQAVKVEETQKGKLFTLGGKQINTRVTRDLNPQPGPQQYIAQAPAQTAAPTKPAGTKNVSPLWPQYLNNPSYPKGIPKSFLQNCPQTPEPYANQAVLSNPTTKWDQPHRVPAPAPAPNVIEYAYNYNPQTKQGYKESRPLYVHIDAQNNPPVVEKQPYSPSDVYADSMLGTSMENEEEVVISDGSESPDLCDPGEKRLSAFQRLGPVTQPKKPKLTINLMCNNDQSIREVVDETVEEEVKPKHVPVHLRADITTSTDETVMKYLMFWPWKKPLPVKKTVTLRHSKSVMILEHEQMIEVYDRSSAWIQVTVTGYPPTWTKNKLLDTLLDTVNGKTFIPCFTEFAPEECKFLVIRSRQALSVFHKIGFIIHKDGHELTISISQTDLTLNQIEFIPKLILKKRLVAGYAGERSLDLSEFTTKDDVSHFIYFPLNRLNNQMDIVQIQSSVAWEYLTDLNLSHNRLNSIEGFNLPSTSPKLKFLDLSHNCLEKATLLLRCRSLSLRTIKLEGNPLCNDFTDPAHYVKVLKLMFPTLVEIDDIPIKLPGEMPPFKKNYCPEAATELIEKFLEVYFPIMDSSEENRGQIRDLYHERACLTITTRYKLRYGAIFKSFRSLLERARVPDEGSLDSIDGAKDIAKLIAKWPPLKHDPFTFTVDVILHEEFLTIFKIGGLVRLTAETLAEDEHLLAFTRTFVLHSVDGAEYKITNELLYWDEPTEEYAHTAFQMTVKPKRLSLKLESTPDDDLKKKLVEIFMKLTDSNETVSEKCLEQKEWNLKSALEYFMKLLKLDDLEALTKEIKV